MASILQVEPIDVDFGIATEKGNGFRLGVGGPEIITFPAATLDPTLYPTNSPIGSLCLDSSYSVAFTETSDLWHKFKNTQMDWAPLSQAYYSINYGDGNGTYLITNNTVTFISFTANTETFNLVFPGTGAQNQNVGSKTVYTDGFYIIVPFDSVYLAYISVGLTDSSTSQYTFYTSFYVNGAEVSRGLNNNFQSGGGTRVSQMTTVLKLNKNDKVSFAAFQNSGVTKNIADSMYTTCGIVNLGTIA